MRVLQLGAYLTLAVIQGQHGAIHQNARGGQRLRLCRLLQQPLPPRPDELARRISDRHFGVGGDGLILICPSQQADARMRMFNADGSESEMCGNGIRCVAKYVYDHGICRKETLRIETGRGVLDPRAGSRRRPGAAGPRRHGRADPRAGTNPVELAAPAAATGSSISGRQVLPFDVPQLDGRCGWDRDDLRFDGQPALSSFCRAR